MGLGAQAGIILNFSISSRVLKCPSQCFIIELKIFRFGYSEFNTNGFRPCFQHSYGLRVAVG